MSSHDDMPKEIDRIKDLFDGVERTLNTLTMKVEFFQEPHVCGHGELFKFGVSLELGFQRFTKEWHITLNGKPMSDCSIKQKIWVAERLSQFEEDYIAHLNELAARARKAGKKS